VGDGPARPGIEAAARRLGVRDRLTVTGPVGRGKLPEFVASFDVALQPAATEYACPMKIPEYLALGKPVVAPDQENIRELVRDGIEGSLFPPGDPTGLVRAIRQLAEDDERRRSLGASAARRVSEEGLTWERNAERVETMVRELREKER
jgi:glycosyltransferase involved in cell wall biosynthesis